MPGPVLFARYAYPPNAHGYCGPADAGAFFEFGASGTDDRGLRAMAQQFAGAWPYLELIAASTGLDDPLDRRVVEAYWVGSPRLDRVSTRAVGSSMEERFRVRTGSQFFTLADSLLAAGSRTTASQCSASIPGPGCSATAEKPSTPSPCWTAAGSGGDRCSQCWVTR